MHHHYHRQFGFSLLETLLAIIVITIAGVGVYSAFNSGLASSDLAGTVDEMVEVANVYTDLAATNLTSSINSSATLIAALKNSGRLSADYFLTNADQTISLIDAYDDAVQFSHVTPYSFTATVPLGVVWTGNKATAASSVASQFCDQVQDVYACVPDAQGANQATVTFSINN